MAEIVGRPSLPPGRPSGMIGRMLELKPTCERCALPLEAADAARICSAGLRARLAAFDASGATAPGDDARH